MEGILATATFRTSRTGQCPLSAENKLKQQGRGIFNYRTNQNSGFYFVKWYDNKCVLIGSNYERLETSTTVERFDVKEKKNVKISCLDMINKYNRLMGGVDLADILISSYCTKRKVRKRLYLRVSSIALILQEPMGGFFIDVIATFYKHQRNTKTIPKFYR